jgi:hypothetical protein
MRSIAGSKSSSSDHTLTHRQAQKQAHSRAKPCHGASFRSCCLFFPILRRGIGFERMKKTGRDLGNFLDCGQKRNFISLGRLVEAANLPHKLERSCPNLFRSYGRIEIEKGFDISAHALDLNVEESRPTENYEIFPFFDARRRAGDPTHKQLQLAS